MALLDFKFFYIFVKMRCSLTSNARNYDDSAPLTAGMTINA